MCFWVAEDLPISRMALAKASFAVGVKPSVVMCCLFCPMVGVLSECGVWFLSVVVFEGVVRWCWGRF